MFLGLSTKFEVRRESAKVTVQEWLQLTNVQKWLQLTQEWLQQ